MTRLDASIAIVASEKLRDYLLSSADPIGRYKAPFFRSLGYSQDQWELLKHRRFKSKAEAKMALFEWIEGWYNPHRRHSSIGRLSPNNFERRLLAGQEVRI